MDNKEYEKLLESLRDRTYRHFFSSASIKRGLAEQIREMRLERRWTQEDLAQASGKAQETISQLENPDYGNYTLKTLQRLAEAFDVALIVRFAPFSELARWITDLSPEDLAVPDYEHDLGLKPAASLVKTMRTAAQVPPVTTVVVIPDVWPLQALSTSVPQMVAGDTTRKRWKHASARTPQAWRA